MKDVNATLRRIDEEIVGHKQRIAMSQVEIARLQDTRQVLQRLVEDDQQAASDAKLQRAGTIAGEHAKPVLIVRKTGTGDEEGTASKARKNGTAVTMHAKVEKPSKRRGLANGWRRGMHSESGDYREKILKTLDPETPMTSREIGDYLGLARNEEARKAMSNALYQLRVKGLIMRDDQNRYSPGQS